MKLEAAELLFSTGTISGAKIYGPMFGTYEIQFIAPKIPEKDRWLFTARGEVREFTTLDAAANVLRKIGFREFTVSEC